MRSDESGIDFGLLSAWYGPREGALISNEEVARWVDAHIGYPWTEEMITLARKHENVYIDTSAYTSKRIPAELTAYVRTGGGRRKVLFGSNYPMIAPKAALADLDLLRLDEEARELYLAGNAKRVFGIDRHAE
jgi:uncharacterized protein